MKEKKIISSSTRNYLLQSLSRSQKMINRFKKDKEIIQLQGHSPFGYTEPDTVIMTLLPQIIKNYLDLWNMIEQENSGEVPKFSVSFKATPGGNS